MLIILPAIILMITSLSLVFLTLIRPDFRYHWLIATLGALLSVIVVLAWLPKLPFSFSIPAWKPQTLFLYSPTWLADDVSWPYAISLSTLGLATITTAIIRKITNEWNWANILFLVSMGLWTVTANNPLTLVIAWLALDITELATLLRTVKEEKSEEIIVGFSIRLGGVFLLLWASIISISSGSIMNFNEMPDGAGFFLLFASLLRLGVFPLQLPINNLVQRRGLITTLRLVSAASGFSLIARIPMTAFPSHILPYLISIAGLLTIFSGWIWFQSTDELAGRPYLISGLGLLSITASLLGNIKGSVTWGISLILSGGLLFLYSGRGKRTYWLLLMSIWGLSALPFSLTDSVWVNHTELSNLFLVPHIFGYSLILAGYFRHAFMRHGDIDITHEPRWVQVIYPVGLSILFIISLTISFWYWLQTRTIAQWWIGTITIILSTIFYFIFYKRMKNSNIFKLPKRKISTNIIPNIFWSIYRFIRQIITLLSSILEGDGGMLWSIVLLVLFISIISQAVQYSQ